MELGNGLIYLAGLCWLVTIIHDVKSRKVSTLVLAGLALVALLGQEWPWWVLTGLALLWPLRWRRYALLLAPTALVTGVIMGEPVIATALVVGSIGWALKWWGGADGIVLLALALRHGYEGILAGVIITVALGIVLTVVRRRSPLGFVDAATGILTQRVLDEDIPPESEIPAAAALAVGGLAMEVSKLWTIMFG